MNSPPTPPNFLLRFFRWFCDPDLHPFIEGDLLERYEERDKQQGHTQADIQLALKERINHLKPKEPSLRRNLIIIRLLGAQFLIAIAFIVLYQINSVSLPGFGSGTIVFIVLPDTIRNLSNFNQRLKQHPHILSLAFGWGGPLLNAGTVQFSRKGGDDVKIQGAICYDNEQYIPRFKQSLLAGANFSATKDNPLSEVIVNQALTKTLAIENPKVAIGKAFTVGGKNVLIKGVLKDVQTDSFGSKLEPLILQYGSSKCTGITIKIATAHVAETLQFIETLWSEIYPGYITNIRFLDEASDQPYGMFDRILDFLKPVMFTFMVSLFIFLVIIYHHSFRKALTNPTIFLKNR